MIALFREGLQKHGWTEGRNTRIDTRWTTPADAESRQRFAKELVALQPDVILSHTTPTTAALLQQTHTIPIIFATVSDPVGSGFVANLARPGGNVTGFANFGPETGGKWLQVFRQIAPRTRSIAMLLNPSIAANRQLASSVEAAAGPLGIAVTTAAVTDSGSLEQALAGPAL